MDPAILTTVSLHHDSIIMLTRRSPSSSTNCSTVVGFMGTGRLTYQEALTAAFIEGFVFLLITVIGVRGKLVKLIPRCILLSTSAGIGLFLAFIGLQSGEGVGVVTYNSATLVTLGGCAPQYRVPQYTFAGTSSVLNPVMASDVCAVNETSGEPMLGGFDWVCYLITSSSSFSSFILLVTI